MQYSKLYRSRIKYFIILFIYLSELNLGQSLSCSGFVIDNNNILLAKNLDWALGNGIIILNPKNKLKKSIYFNSNNSSWTSIYSSITFNHFGLNQPLGGMNEKGLAIEELSTWPVEYYQNDSLILSEFEWIQYQLDKYSTTNEVLKNIDKASIAKFYFQIHYLIVDKIGDTAIVEFINGEPKVYQSDSLIYPVLTNNNYSELVKYYNLVSELHLKKLNVNLSQDRFIKIAILLNDGINLQNSNNYLFAMNILDSVKVYDTQWSIVYDISNMTIYYKTKYDKSINSILFSPSYAREIDFKYIPLELKDRNGFRIFDINENSKYLEKLSTDIIKQYGNDGSELLERINIYMKQDYE